MNSPTPFFSRRGPCLRLVFLSCLALFFLSGCLDKQILWSPDGQRALLVSDKGLFLSNSEGKLSGPLLENVVQTAWLADPSRAVVAVEHETRDWKLCSELLGAAKAAKVEKSASDLVASLEAGTAIWSVATLNLKNDKAPLFVCLHSLHLDRLRARLSEAELKQLSGHSLEYRELAVVRIEADKAIVERMLVRSLGDVGELRPSPDGKMLAWVESGKDDRDKTYLLSLVPIDGSSPRVEVSRASSAYPDWTPDGASLVYAEITGKILLKEDEGQLSVIRLRKVRDADGRISVANESEELAGLLYDPSTRIRCLKDGRILFNATDLSLPSSKSEMKNLRQRLCVLDLTRQSTIVKPVPMEEELKLPETLAYFEPSPDGSQVLFAGGSTDVSLLTLVSGEVTVIQERSKKGHSSFPAWRKAGEFSYFKRDPAYAVLKKGEADPVRGFEIVQRNGDAETVLSRDWSNEFLGSLQKGK